MKVGDRVVLVSDGFISIPKGSVGTIKTFSGFFVNIWFDCFRKTYVTCVYGNIVPEKLYNSKLYKALK